MLPERWKKCGKRFWQLLLPNAKKKGKKDLYHTKSIISTKITTMQFTNMTNGPKLMSFWGIYPLLPQVRIPPPPPLTGKRKWAVPPPPPVTPLHKINHRSALFDKSTSKQLMKLWNVTFSFSCFLQKQWNPELDVCSHILMASKISQKLIMIKKSGHFIYEIMYIIYQSKIQNGWRRCRQ